MLPRTRQLDFDTTKIGWLWWANIVASSPLALKTVSEVVRSLVRIERLAVNNLDKEAFDYLARLPTLPWLRLENPVEPAKLLRASPSPHSYPSLQTLVFGLIPIERATAFANTIANCPLGNILLDWCDESAARRAETTSLFLFSSHPSVPTPPFARSDLRSPRFRVSPFENLKQVSVEQMCGFDLTDTDIHDLASAWQRLSHLALTAIEHVAPLHVTPQSDPTSAKDSIPPRCPTLANTTHSAVENSPITAPELVAHFISDIFLGAMIRTLWRYPVYMDRWEKVKALVAELSQKQDGDAS
ncbi:hypothetical protein DFH08DRAFT_966249 [Mycena albidolilacea]|uniref:Uncharacterized protein n=1 Tax=Mycena albidolilacea TaxID=1033008 RepID=A0AAD6ZQA2_9AGAR|nr:hypothetical protein DFH08DRAFT_966249 [Mycena albidolilacea]